MSTFDGVLKEYPLISIDNFTQECGNYLSTIYFLSHCHKDHMRGLGDHKFLELLASRGFSKIYLSSVSEHLLKNDPEYFHLSSFLVGFPMEEPMLIGIPDFQGNICSQIVVTLLTAGHCPGSVMFLLEGSNGRVLYTGDFRLPVGSSARLIDLHDEHGRLKKLDSLYVDTTFCREECLYIPSREECLNAIISLVEPWLAKGPEHIVYFFCPAQYAYEFVFVELFKKFKVKTHVTEEKENKYQGIKIIEDAVTSVSTDARIHACMYDMDMLPFNEYEVEAPCGYHTLDYKPIKIMKIKPSAMFFKNKEFKEISAFERKKQFHRVCYSTHSSLSEIRDLVQYLKPKFLYPNVVQRQTVEEILDLLHFPLSSDDSTSELTDEQESAPPLGMLKTIYEEDNILNSSDSMPFFDECYELPLKQPKAISSLPANLHQDKGSVDIEQDVRESADTTVRPPVTSPIKWDFTLSSEDELSSSPIKLNSASGPSKSKILGDSSIETFDKSKTVSHKNLLISENQNISILEESMSDSFELRASVKEKINKEANNCSSNNASNKNNEANDYPSNNASNKNKESNYFSSKNGNNKNKEMIAYSSNNASTKNKESNDFSSMNVSNKNTEAKYCSRNNASNKNKGVNYYSSNYSSSSSSNKNKEPNDCSSKSAKNKNITDSCDKKQNNYFMKNMSVSCEEPKNNVCERKGNTEAAMFSFLNDNLSHLFSSEENEVLPANQSGNDVKCFKKDILEHRTGIEESSVLNKESNSKSNSSKKLSNLDEIVYTFFKNNSVATSSKSDTNQKHSFNKDNIRYEFFKKTSPDRNLEFYFCKENTTKVPVQALAPPDIKQTTNENEHYLKEISLNESKFVLIDQKSHSKDASFYNCSIKKPLFKDRSNVEVNKSLKVNSYKHHTNEDLCESSKNFPSNSSQIDASCVSSGNKGSRLNQLVTVNDKRSEFLCKSVALPERNVAACNVTRAKDEQKNYVSFHHSHLGFDSKFDFIEQCEDKKENAMFNKHHNHPVLSENNVGCRNVEDGIHYIDENSNDSVCVMSNDKDQRDKSVELIELSSDDSDEDQYYVGNSYFNGKANCDTIKTNNLGCYKNSRQISKASKIMDSPSDTDDSPSLIEPKKAKLSVENNVSDHSAVYPGVRGSCLRTESAVALANCSNNPELPSFESTPDDLPLIKDDSKNSFLRSICDEIIIDDDS